MPDEEKNKENILAKKKDNNAERPLEKQLWKSADKLRKNIDAAEYKHIVLVLIFLKYISDAFEELFNKLKTGKGEYEGADPEDKDEYKAENVFFVPVEARWNFLLSKAKQPTIGKSIDDAMDAIEKENSSLKGVLPKVYARQNLDAWIQHFIYHLAPSGQAVHGYFKMDYFSEMTDYIKALLTRAVCVPSHPLLPNSARIKRKDLQTM